MGLVFTVSEWQGWLTMGWSHASVWKLGTGINDFFSKLVSVFCHSDLFLSSLVIGFLIYSCMRF